MKSKTIKLLSIVSLMLLSFNVSHGSFGLIMKQLRDGIKEKEEAIVEIAVDSSGYSLEFAQAAADRFTEGTVLAAAEDLRGIISLFEATYANRTETLNKMIELKQAEAEANTEDADIEDESAEEEVDD